MYSGCLMLKIIYLINKKDLFKLGEKNKKGIVFSMS